MKYIGIIAFILYLLLTICYTTFAQKNFINPYTSSIDSLQYLLRTKTVEDTERVMTLDRLARRLTGSKPDTAVLLLKEAKKLADKLNFFHGQLRYYLDVGNIRSSLLTMPENFYADSMAIVMAKQYKGFDYLGSAYNGLGCYYKIVEKHDSATKYFLLTKAEYEKDTNLVRFLPIAYANLSTEYLSLGDYKNALYYGNKAIGICRKYNIRTSRFDVALNNTANAYKAAGNYDSAAILYKEEIALADENQEPFNKLGVLGNYAEIFAIQHKYPQMLEYATQEYKLAKEFNNPENICNALIGMTNAMLCNKRYKEANAFAQQALECSKANAIPENLHNLYKTMAYIAFAEGNIDNGLNFESIADSIQHEVNNKNILSFTIEFETKLEVEKKDAQIATQKLESRQKLWVIIGLLLGLVILCILGFVQYQNYKNKQKLAIQGHQLAIAEERIRIANDMHDDVGVGLSRIRYITTNMASTGIVDNEKLDKIVALSDESVEKMNEIIWALNQGNQNLDDLVYFIRSQCAEMANNAGITFICDLPNDIPNLVFGWKENRNTYLLTKEAVNNAIKHAQANTITINFLIDQLLTITITDDGKGFSTSTKSNGNGLLNFQKRINQLKGSYTLQTAPDKGTSIQFIIPLYPV